MIEIKPLVFQPKGEKPSCREECPFMIHTEAPEGPFVPLDRYYPYRCGYNDLKEITIENMGMCVNE